MNERKPTAYQGTEPYIFVSYAHADKEIVWPFILALQEKYNVWYDEGIEYGAAWVDIIPAKIMNCAVIVCFLTSACLSSEVCKKELYYAQRKGKVIVFVLPRAIEEFPPWFEFDFDKYQRCSLFGFTSLAAAVLDLGRKCSKLALCAVSSSVRPEMRKSVPPRREGNAVLFGLYPQSKVAQGSGLEQELTRIAGALPTEEAAHGWTSYRYYIEGSNDEDFMWYKDVRYANKAYRGVYFVRYRPQTTTKDKSTCDGSRQDENGYLKDTVYWFAYEPLCWRILEEKAGVALLVADKCVDSREFYAFDALRYDEDGVPVHPNNYRWSNIRAWLNDEFLRTAFTEDEQAHILVTDVDNSARSANPDAEPERWGGGANRFACLDTQDKVFLLSEQEATRTAYGFDADCEAYDPARRRRSTDYANSQGCDTIWSTADFGYYSWWVRSPKVEKKESVDYYMHGVRYDGRAEGDSPVYATYRGIVPALRIKLS